MADFMKRNNSVMSLKMPQVSSLAGATAFNRPVVEAFFFTNYNETVKNISSVLNFSVPSERKGVTVTIIGCINALVNSIPSVLISTYVHFKNYMLISAPPGTHETSHHSNWSNRDKFL